MSLITITDRGLASVESATRNLLLESYSSEIATAVWNRIDLIKNPTSRLDLCGLIYADLTSGKKELTSLHEADWVKYNHKPVDIHTFLTDSYFMNAKKVIYPEVLKELIEINSGKYVEVVCTGGIGSGKTTTALYTTAYQLYLLSCMKEPHAQFDLDPSSEIMFVFQSIRKKTAEETGYNRFRAMIERSRYFMEEFKFDKELKSKLAFPNRIEVQPVSSVETATIGENIMGGVIDELNYMGVIEKSRASIDGGVYDQAIALYRSIATRRRSRFMKHGVLPGILCLVSSRRYPGQFTDIKEEEARTDPTIYVYDKCTWHVKPGAYGKERFKVFVGDEFRKPKVLSKEDFRGLDKEDRKRLVRSIPLEELGQFEKDIIKALREIAGVSTMARFPFIMDTEAVQRAMSKKRKSIFSTDSCDFEGTQLQFYPDRFTDLSEPRWAHVDLGLTSDSAGVAIGYVEKFTKRMIGQTIEMLPNYVIDGILEVRPPKGGEIKFWKIRELFYKLRELGLPIKWITYDSYQSVDSLQLLHNQKFETGTVSLDTDIRGYEVLKTGLYDDCLEMPEHKKARKEIVSLEREPKKGKIDHPPHGSKDCADAIAGVVFGLVRRQEIYTRHSISKSQIPQSVRDMLAKGVKMREFDE